MNSFDVFVIKDFTVVCKYTVQCTACSSFLKSRPGTYIMNQSLQCYGQRKTVSYSYIAYSYVWLDNK